MKTPQRRFVVEFKSARRQPKAPKNSIWGDTDLKALAREVEEKASHLFSSTEAPPTPYSAEIVPAGPINSDLIGEGAGSEDAGDVDTARAVMPPADGAELDTVREQKRQPGSQPRTTWDAPRKRTKRAPTPTIAQSSKGGHEDSKAQAGTVKNPISLDELAALDADNKRLRRLLAEQLHAQNLLLKKRLARFDAA